MQNGNLGSFRAASGSPLPLGSVITASGRLSAARTDDSPTYLPPFVQKELIALDDALIRCTRDARIRFSVYVGQINESNSDDFLAQIFASCPESRYGVLIAADPNENTIAIVTGSGVSHRVTSQVVNNAITSAQKNLREGELIYGLIAAMDRIATQVQ